MQRMWRVEFALLALVLLATVGASPAWARQAPDFQLPDLDGRTRSLQEFRGKIVVLDFWATWCGPCRRLMSEFLAPMHLMYGDDSRFELIGVGLGETAQTQKQFAQSQGFKWLKLHDVNSTVGRQYGVQGIPHLVVLDEQGQIIAEGNGFQVAQPLSQYLAERLGGEGPLSASSGVGMAGAPGGTSAGGGQDVTQVIVLLIVIAIVVAVSVRKEKTTQPHLGSGGVAHGSGPAGPTPAFGAGPSFPAVMPPALDRNPAIPAPAPHDPWLAPQPQDAAHAPQDEANAPAGQAAQPVPPKHNPFFHGPR